jgi:hypothetical protein
MLLVACVASGLLSVAATTTATAAPIEYLPCTVGLSIEYTDQSRSGAGPTLKMTETIRGPGKEARTCVIDRVIQKPDGQTEKDAWMREMLPDRIANAGWVDRPVAFRTPILRAPIQAGKKWHFNTTDFEIKEADATIEIAAGKFERCVRVTERSTDGTHEASSIYAPKVGLILYESRSRRVEAVKVMMPGAHENAQDRASNINAPVRKARQKRTSQESSKTSR